MRAFSRPPRQLYAHAGYRTGDNRIDGAVLLLTDITDLKRGTDEVRRARDYASAIVETSGNRS